MADASRVFTAQMRIPPEPLPFATNVFASRVVLRLSSVVCWVLHSRVSYFPLYNGRLFWFPAKIRDVLLPNYSIAPDKKAILILQNKLRPIKSTISNQHSDYYHLLDSRNYNGLIHIAGQFIIVANFEFNRCVIGGSLANMIATMSTRIVPPLPPKHSRSTLWINFRRLQYPID